MLDPRKWSLQEALAAARAGTVQVVLLRGEAGSGRR